MCALIDMIESVCVCVFFKALAVMRNNVAGSDPKPKKKPQHELCCCCYYFVLHFISFKENKKDVRIVAGSVVHFLSLSPPTLLE